MTNRIKMGPLAIFLAIIAIILTMLALLDFATSNADVALADRYAEVSQIKYELDKKGNEFLSEIDAALKSGEGLLFRDDVTRKSNGIYIHTEEEQEYTLTIEFETKGTEYEIRRWKINKEWEETNPFGNIWQP